MPPPRTIALFDNPLPEPEPRQRREPGNRYSYTRPVKGRAFQARVWVRGPGGEPFSLNLGLFTLARHDYDPELAEWAAGRASREFCKRWSPGRTVRAVVAELQREGLVPARVRVPRRVRGWRPPTDFGECETPAERRERERREWEWRRYGCGLLAYLPAAA